MRVTGTFALHPFAFPAVSARRSAASFRSSRVGKEATGMRLIHLARTEARLWRNPRTSAKPSFARSTRICAATSCATFRKKYAGWLIAAVVLFLAASGGWIYWQDYQQKQSEKAVEQLAQIYHRHCARARSIPRRAARRPDRRSMQGGPRLGRVRPRRRRDRSRTTPSWRLPNIRAIAGDTSLPKPFRDLALIRQTALEFDSLKPEEVIARLQPLPPSPASPGSAAPAR